MKCKSDFMTPRILKQGGLAEKVSYRQCIACVMNAQEVVFRAAGGGGWVHNVRRCRTYQERLKTDNQVTNSLVS